MDTLPVLCSVTDASIYLHNLGPHNSRCRTPHTHLQGRSFDLVYTQYFTENFHFLKTVLAMAEAVNPTHLVANTGIWLRLEGPGCFNDAPTKCPSTAWLCDFLRTPHSFRTLWLSTTPCIVRSREVPTVPPSHPIHVPTICGLPPHQVVDRTAVLHALEPDAADRATLWWTSDNVHFHADANHGFNQALLNSLAQTPAGLGRRWLPFS